MKNYLRPLTKVNCCVIVKKMFRKKVNNPLLILLLLLNTAFFLIFAFAMASCNSTSSDYDGEAGLDATVNDSGPDQDDSALTDGEDEDGGYGDDTKVPDDFHDAGDFPGGDSSFADALDSSSGDTGFGDPTDGLVEDGADGLGSTDEAHDAGSHDADSGPDPSVFCQELDSSTQLIADRRFRRGFIALDQDTHLPSGSMPTGFCQGAPIWNIAQWDSLGDLSQSQRQTLPSGSVRWSNDYGRVTVGLLQSADADLALGVWAYQEYGGQYHTPTPDRVWVHLLAEQRISPPGTTRPGCPPISSLESLDFNLVARLLQDIPHYQQGYDPDRHAAQFLIYFTVQNLNQLSPGFGDYLWLGITPYDDRYDIVGTFIQGDLGGDMGTGKLIYNLGAQPFISEGLTPSGPEETFSKDILPDVRQALLEAWNRGYLPDSHVLSDYRIGGMNIGWEVPGLNDVEMQVRDLSLSYQVRTAQPVVFGFDTDGDAQGWTTSNMIDLGSAGPEGGTWILQVPGDDPFLTSPELNLEAATHPTLRLVIANDHNPAGTSTLQVYWDRFGEPGFREAWSVSAPISNGGGWQTVDFDMSANPQWRGEISHIRIDPVTAGDGHSIGLDQISILP